MPNYNLADHLRTHAFSVRRQGVSQTHQRLWRSSIKHFSFITLAFAACISHGYAEPSSINYLNVAIIQRNKLTAALSASSTQRVAVVGLGDSNQAFGGTGWGYFFQKWLYTEFGCFGSGLMPMGSPYTSNNPGYLSGAGRNNSGATSGAPVALHIFSPGGGDIPNEGIYSYAYVADGMSQAIASNQWSGTITTAHPMNIAGNLRIRMSYGTFAGGNPTSFTPRARYFTGGGATLATGTTINPVTGSYGVADYILDIPAGSRAAEGLAFMPSNFGTTIAGPFIGYFISYENMDKITGLTYSTLLRDGGSSLYDMLVALNTHGDTALTEYFRQHRLQLTTGSKSIVIFLNSGLNDQGETGTSIGPIGGLANSSAGGFADNANGIISKLESNWISAGGSSDTIHFCLMVSHPYAAADGGSSGLPRYRLEAAKIALTRSNCSAINLPMIHSYEDFFTNSWFDSRGPFHLTANGYDEVTKSVVKEIARPLSTIEQWRIANFGVNEATGPTANDADPDMDGQPNLLEFALGGNALVADANLITPQVTITGRRLSIRFSRQPDPNLTYEIEASSNLEAESWSVIWSSTGSSNVGGQVAITDVADLVIPSRRFLRLQVR